MKSELNYHDSSQQDQPISKKDYKQLNDHQCQKKVQKYYAESSPQLYYHKIRQILESNVEKDFLKKLLLIDNNEKEIIDNLYRRQQKYKYFMKDIEMDRKHRTILTQKSIKTHQQNQIKKEKYLVQKQQRQHQADKLKLQKFIIQKQQVQNKLTTRLQKKVRTLGIDRAHTSHQTKKQYIDKVREKHQNKFDSIKNKQNNELSEMKQILEKIKKQKRFNKIQQDRLLRDYREEINGMKKKIENKCEQYCIKKSQFKV